MLKPKRTILLLICLTILFASFVGAQNKVQKINNLLQSYSEFGQFNGAVLVADADKVIYRKSFGSANFEWQIPNLPDTKFRVGSITKSFTAILILQLAERGKLDLDGKITDYLPNFSKEFGDKVSIRQLLTHTSGLPDYNNVPFFFRQVQSGLLSKEDILKRIGGYDLLFEPGAKFNYSNDGYRILGAIIEKITGKPFQTALQENILNPAGMNNTGYASRNEILEKRASGYGKTLAGLENAPFYEASPASGMFSTIDDLYLWQQALEQDKLLSAKSIELMWSISPNGNAYGWHVSHSAENGLKLMSEGAVFGFFARFVRLPQRKQTIILLTNVRAGTNFLPNIEQGITDILQGRAFQMPKKSIAETLFATLKQNDIGAALNQYAQLKRNQPDKYNFAETELNSLGYYLLRSQRVKEAIEIFKLNVEAFPQSSNVYDSLGEAYMTNGDKELAIKNYQKSVELNPQNTGGIEALKKLKGN